MSMKEIKIKRVYDKAAATDGVRILVDRVWPRGMTKAKLRADIWLKEVAPSAELRKWFAHDPAKWNEFKRRYFAELNSKPEIVDEIRQKSAVRPVTLLYSAHDSVHNQAVALREYLLSDKVAGKQKG